MIIKSFHTSSLELVSNFLTVPSKRSLFLPVKTNLHPDDVKMKKKDVKVLQVYLLLHGIQSLILKLKNIVLYIKLNQVLFL